ncbi:phosphoribosylformylglycinamidine cyclo-ligase [Thermosipho ferrireducens]|uniref:Phosphoribosylformylglycinamidine cyclo-ligase n=1 Tax=Thermosipho ferrireducens TaxID=2571116 RepID=A0ABX7S6U5_9BACT|nr:phosphoribosylformylglycinamidine cyclo-ligase [Thermosipho ferrireducens]QTA38302.1 phosphoribosylformylglycinamidine cyclo-ligase [Thermosipho ferrireducens]
MEYVNYEDSGVNINEANKMVESIKDKLKENAGMYGAVFPIKNIVGEYKEPVLVMSTDGVGTKMILLEKKKRWDIAAQDLAAMVLNDIVCVGAKPLFFLDYYATGKLNSEDGSEFLNNLVKVLESVNCKLIGGETAELPGLLINGRVDVAGFGVGVVEKEEMLGKHKVCEGDIIIGLKSNGIHSNGFSLVRKLLEMGKLKFTEDLIAPTKLVVNQTLAVSKYIKSAAHITGGGIVENVPRVIPDGLTANIKFTWEIPEVFKEILNTGVLLKEAFRVFNMGIGMVYILDERNFDTVRDILKTFGEDVILLGKVTLGNEKIKISF